MVERGQRGPVWPHWREEGGESVVAESKMIARAILSEFLCNHVNSVYSALGTVLRYNIYQVI